MTAAEMWRGWEGWAAGTLLGVAGASSLAALIKWGEGERRSGGVLGASLRVGAGARNDWAQADRTAQAFLHLPVWSRAGGFLGVQRARLRAVRSTDKALAGRSAAFSQHPPHLWVFFLLVTT